MARAVALRADFDAAQLRALARMAKDGPQTRRLLALAAISDGGTRSQAAAIGGVGLQTVRDWEEGIRRPDSAAKTYLRLIEKNPEAVIQLLKPESSEEPGSPAAPREKRVG